MLGFVIAALVSVSDPSSSSLDDTRTELIDPFATNAAGHSTSTAPGELVDPFAHPRSARPDAPPSRDELLDPFAPRLRPRQATPSPFPGLRDPFQ